MSTRCVPAASSPSPLTAGVGSGRRLPRLGAWALIAAAFGMALGGCSPIEPWVKPYEREHFADPIMAFNRDPVSSVYREHVFESREGARGATGGVGGGCGCN